MAGTLNIFTRTLAAGNSLAFTGGEGLHSISVLCKTDNSGAAGITVLGTLSVGGTASNSITILAHESGINDAKFQLTHGGTISSSAFAVDTVYPIGVRKVVQTTGYVYILHR